MLTELLSSLDGGSNAYVVEQLEFMIAERRLPHALIIEGENSELNGKLARIVARAYLCSCEQPLSGQCRSCQVFEHSGTHPDFYLVEGSGSTGAISVDSIREVKGRSSIVPTDADGTVYLMENVDTMLPRAQNAFLKLFEEPPDGVMFIMTCFSRMKLLETIRSRGSIMHFEWEEKQPSEEDKPDIELADRLAAALISRNELDALLVLAPLCNPKGRDDTAKLRKRLLVLLERLEEIFRQSMLLSVGAEQALAEIYPSARELAKTISFERQELLVRELEPLERAIRSNIDLSLMTATICARLRRTAGF